MNVGLVFTIVTKMHIVTILTQRTRWIQLVSDVNVKLDFMVMVLFVIISMNATITKTIVAKDQLAKISLQLTQNLELWWILEILRPDFKLESLVSWASSRFWICESIVMVVSNAFANVDMSCRLSYLESAKISMNVLDLQRSTVQQSMHLIAHLTLIV